MAKDIIERAPFKFDPYLYDITENIHYFQKCSHAERGTKHKILYGEISRMVSSYYFKL